MTILLTEGGLRRANFYIQHLLIDEQGEFAPTLCFVGKTKDHGVVGHLPVQNCTCKPGAQPSEHRQNTVKIASKHGDANSWIWRRQFSLSKNGVSWIW